MNIREDHAHEQFFFADNSRARLVELAQQYRHPLLLCMPSVAVDLDAMGHAYTLLDRDTRFQHLRGYERFDLRRPHMVFTSFDAIFCDPPFSNLSLRDLRGVVDVLCMGTASVPDVFLCYIRTREALLLEVFAAHALHRLGSALRYQSVKPHTQDQIFLYGPSPDASLG